MIANIIFQRSSVDNTKNTNLDDRELFSAVYHKLVHSTALETILNVEHSYAVVMQDLIKERDEHLSDLSAK